MSIFQQLIFDQNAGVIGIDFGNAGDGFHVAFKNGIVFHMADPQTAANPAHAGSIVDQSIVAADVVGHHHHSITHSLGH